MGFLGWTKVALAWGFPAILFLLYFVDVMDAWFCFNAGLLVHLLTEMKINIVYGVYHIHLGPWKRTNLRCTLERSIWVFNHRNRYFTKRDSMPFLEHFSDKMMCIAIVSGMRFCVVRLSSSSDSL